MSDSNFHGTTSSSSSMHIEKSIRIHQQETINGTTQIILMKKTLQPTRAWLIRLIVKATRSVWCIVLFQEKHVGMPTCCKSADNVERMCVPACSHCVWSSHVCGSCWAGRASARRTAFTRVSEHNLRATLCTRSTHFALAAQHPSNLAALLDSWLSRGSLNREVTRNHLETSAGHTHELV